MVRVGIAYTVTAWLLIQVADVVMENIGAPEWVMKALLFVLVVGVVPALIFAWVFELTLEGIKLESEIEAGTSVVHQTRRKLDVSIIVLLVGVVAYLYWDSRLREPGAASTGTSVAASDVANEAAPQPPSGFEPGEKSIAALPFLNLWSDPEQEYFSDGISEELLNVLAQIPQLRVAARTSSFQFKGDNRDISEIAELLKVHHVLEGSVRKAGSRLRITAQLIEADNGYHLWSETYDRELEDVFAIQDEISRAIAEALRAELALDDQPMVAGTSNKPAYEAFLKGRALLNQRGNPAITAGVRELEKSVRLDPTYAPARAQLAIGIALLARTSYSYGDLPISVVNLRAGKQIEAAEALDNNIAELWAAKAILASINSDSEAAIAYADSAIAIRPNYVDALNWRLNELGFTGRYAEAIAAREELLAIDPLSVIGRMNSVATIAMRDPGRAKDIARSIAPQSAWAGHAGLANVYVVTQDASRELAELLKAFAIDADDMMVNSRLVGLFARYGLEDEALRVDSDLRGIAHGSLDQPEASERAFRAQLVGDPQSVELQVSLAEQLYRQGRFEEAVELYDASLVNSVHGPRVVGNVTLFQTIWHADALRQVGRDADADAVQSTAHGALNAMVEATAHVGWTLIEMALLAAVEGNEAEMEDALARAIDAGIDLDTFFTAPALARFADREGLQSLRLDARTLRDRNREKIIELICDNNPVPNEWRPLNSTCSTARGRSI